MLTLVSDRFKSLPKVVRVIIYPTLTGWVAHSVEADLIAAGCSQNDVLDFWMDSSTGGEIAEPDPTILYWVDEGMPKDDGFDIRAELFDAGDLISTRRARVELDYYDAAPYFWEFSVKFVLVKANA